MERRVLNSVAVVCVVIGIATAYFWVRSYACRDMLYLYLGEFPTFGFEAAGGIIRAHYEVEHPAGTHWEIYFGSFPIDKAYRWPDWYGFDMATDSRSVLPYYLSVPCWCPIAVVGLVSWVCRWRAKRARPAAGKGFEPVLAESGGATQRASKSA